MTYDLLIDGKIVPSEERSYFKSINPSDGKAFAQVADASSSDVRRAISAARLAFDNGSWSGLSLKKRGVCLAKVAQLIRDNAKELADLECRDTGKTVKQTTFIDIPTCAETFAYFAEMTAPLDESPNNVAAPVESVTRREPLGVVGCLIPWNYPLIMAAWKMAPALLAGNTVVFRPSSSASVSVMKLAQLMAEAGFPPGVVNIVSCSAHGPVQEIIESPQVNKIAFTGGTGTGQAVMRQAASTMKRLTLELGGKSPNIVFADCDREAALGGTLAAIFMNQGQMCTAGARLLLEEKIYDEFLNELVIRTQALKIGPAANHDTDFGPLISEKHRISVMAHIRKGVEQGATLACGGKIPGGEDLPSGGYYFEPTIFTEVTPDMTIVREEIFGPVLTVMRFGTEEEALRIANDTEYGLAACLWTKDSKKARRVSEKLQCGTVWVNTYGGFYNEAPFGGYKMSGFGRELGKEGLKEYTQTKHICMDKTPGGRPLVSSWF